MYQRALIAAFLLVPNLVFAQVGTDSIAVVGRAETQIAPDGATWKLEIRGKDSDLQKVKQVCDEALGAIAGATRDLGIPDEDVEIGRISIRKVYEQDQKSFTDGDFKHFDLRRTVLVRERDLAKHEAYLDRLVVDPNVAVDMNWTFSDYDSVMDDLRIAALGDAMDKAKALADRAGVEVGGPIVISEYKPTVSAQEISVEDHLGGDAAWHSDRYGLPEKINVDVRIYAAFELVAGK